MSKDNSNLETITPTLAAAWLELNTSNRKLKPAIVKKYTQDMLSGNWKTNGETIKFSDNGTLLDGQHRLAACVRSNLNLTSYVVRSVPAEHFSTIDIGTSRTINDTLGIMKVSEASYVSKALRLIYYWEQNHFVHVHVPRSTILGVFARHPGLVESANFVRFLTKTHGSVIPGQIAVFGHYLFAKADSEKAATFFVSLYDGLDLSKNSPVYMLRSRFLRSTSLNYSVSETIKATLLVKAWNMYYTGKEQSFLRYHKGESFPLIAGLAAND